MKANLTRRKFVKFSPFTGLILSTLNHSTAHAEMGSALIQCAHCSTGFRVEFSYNSGGGGSDGYSCPKCNKSSRVYWNHKGNVEKVTKA